MRKSLDWKGLYASVPGEFGTAINLYGDYTSYQRGEISGQRLGYRIGGTAASVAAPYIYGAIVGTEATPGFGTLIGIGVGAIFTGGEYLYDMYPSIKEGTINTINQINGMESALRHFWR